MTTTQLRASAGPRIERLPSGKVLAGITAALGAAFFFEAVDSGTINYFLPVFAGEF